MADGIDLRDGTAQDWKFCPRCYLDKPGTHFQIVGVEIRCLAREDGHRCWTRAEAVVAAVDSDGRIVVSSFCTKHADEFKRRAADPTQQPHAHACKESDR